MKWLFGVLWFRLKKAVDTVMWYNQFLCEFTNAKQNPQQRCSLYLRLHHLAYAFSFPATQTLGEHLQSFLLPVIMCFGCPNYSASPHLLVCLSPCIYFPLLGIFPLNTPRNIPMVSTILGPLIVFSFVKLLFWENCLRRMYEQVCWKWESSKIEVWSVSETEQILSLNCWEVSRSHLFCQSKRLIHKVLHTVDVQ